MKKILSITYLAILLFATKAYSQSNITLTVKDVVKKGYFKQVTTINTNLSGFNNKDEASVVLEKINSNPEVASAIVSNSDAKGNCDVQINMRQPHNKEYYVSMARKLNVDYIQINGNKKTPNEIIQEIRNKK